MTITGLLTCLRDFFGLSSFLESNFTNYVLPVFCNVYLLATNYILYGFLLNALGN